MADVVQKPGLRVDLNGSSMTRVVSARCTFGYDQRFAEAEVTYTSGESLSPTYWDEVEIYADANTVPATTKRFKGYVLRFDSTLWPGHTTMFCKGQLYVAEFVKNPNEEGTDLSDGGNGQTDQAMVQAVLTACGVPYVAGNIGGTGQTLGTQAWHLVDRDGTPTIVGPFVWQKGESGLAFIDRLDEISVPDDASGKYRTFESLAGDVFRVKITPNPQSGTADFTFTEDVDLLEATVTHDVTDAANKCTARGWDDGSPLGAVESTQSAVSAVLPSAIDVTYPVDSDMIERENTADAGDGIACEAVAAYEVAARNVETVTVAFRTYRGDLLGPGQIIDINAATTLGVDQTTWLRTLTVEVTARNQFYQHVECVVKN